MLDASGVAEALEAALPHGARARQLSARTLVVGMLVALAEGRPAQLTRVQPLSALPEADRARLGVVADWRTGPHASPTARWSTRPGSWPRSGQSRPDGQPSAALAGFAPPCWRPACPSGPSPCRLAGRGLDRHGELRLSAGARRAPQRRRRSVLGPPPGPWAGAKRRAVLWLLPLRRHHGQ